MKVLLEADGGSRGNPGPAGFGAVVFSADRGTVLAESKSAIGVATNNVAEYRGLIAGLAEAADLGATEVSVAMDSKLVIEQMAGRWKVKNASLAELHRQARDLAARFDRVDYRWIPRAQNSHADRLANEAMDAAAEVLDPGSRNRIRPRRKNPPRPAGPGRAGHPPGCCCCGTARPNFRCSAATPGGVTPN